VRSAVKGDELSSGWSVWGTGFSRTEHEALQRASRSVRWWPAALALVALGAVYTLIADSLTAGPRYAVLGIAVVGVAATWALRRQGRLRALRLMTMAVLVLVTASVSISVGYLVLALLQGGAEAAGLLEGGVLLWLSNIVVFSLWYWETDGGGPAVRHARQVASTDFAFPQMVMPDTGHDHGGQPWMPAYLDYLFLAFNTSTAFSPTDTLVLHRRAKVLMMYQACVSLVVVAVLVARAVNAL
jgi:hypothetical protein